MVIFSLHISLVFRRVISSGHFALEPPRMRRSGFVYEPIIVYNMRIILNSLLFGYYMYHK